MSAADALGVIAARRSVGRLDPPGPDDDQLDTILGAATMAPDHKELRPWRFVVLRGEAKDSFGEILASTYLSRCQAAGTPPTEGQLHKERTKLGRAPVVVVAAVAPAADAPVPEVERLLAVGAAVQNLLLAATALGFGSMWRTGDPAYDPAVVSALRLEEGARVVGFVYLGSVPEDRRPPPHEPDTAGVVSRWEP
ncbi:MAG TPA: nitroreductase [Acidimicrobiales bacterium]|nr:nitroreductase [Acidimicrobiales bacterium]